MNSEGCDCRAMALVSQDAVIENALEKAGEELRGEGLSVETYLKVGISGRGRNRVLNSAK